MGGDDTVILRPGKPRRSAKPVLIAVCLGVVLGVAGLGLRWAGAPPPSPPIPAADEAALRAESPAVRTTLRFAPNPAIVVLDFPTLAEQGRMLNRLAAWAEKAGVPHDRLLNDADLDAAIRATGATPATYYYGHDYRASDIARFFALSESDHVLLDAEEGELRQLTRRAAAEPAGFGALITTVRADAANEVDAAARATILHHELSHGQYFTDPAYARFVNTVWTSVLTASERARFRTYLTAEGYDPALEDVMVNEMQAYLMHTADPRFFDPAKLGIPPARLAEIRQSFAAGMPASWLRDAVAAPPVPPRPLPRRRRSRRAQGRVSSRSKAAETLPPRRRRTSAAAPSEVR